MGQYWQLVNIDKREHFGHMGKLGEAFLDKYGLADAIALLGGLEVDEINTYDTEDSDSDDESAPTFYDFTCRFKEIRSRRSIDLGGMHVYVRRDVVAKELADEPYPGDIGNVLLMNICWSDDSSCSMMFDVVPLSLVEDDEEKWEDVTEDQVKLTRPALQW
ncbi:hypothetical protein IW261DRAFT_1490819 [Armillaria novae-zelandiae]|uniref:Uncharacterized protein n=1 Tax=Armillaria novae-zelandiae TaxID=153914 RepID=A0AA39U7S8_9AGAR|nr:hypothetical protein IW261DRAFT_1490819 [Armillaria novae-zelandiae]